MTFQVRPELAVVDLYLARARLRAEVSMQGFTRLSDLFNSAPGDFIGVSMRLPSAAGGARAVRDLVVRLRDVRLIRPIDERLGPASPAARRDRIPARVVIDLDDCQVTGDVHLVDRIRWLDYATGIANRFISMSNASVRFVGVPEPLECEYLLVNGGRISALYEVA